jgi:hypothetical protein
VYTCHLERVHSDGLLGMAPFIATASGSVCCFGTQATAICSFAAADEPGWDEDVEETRGGPCGRLQGQSSLIVADYSTYESSGTRVGARRCAQLAGSRRMGNYYGREH